LLSSRLLDWVVKQTATSMRGGWYSFESRFIRDLPIAVHTDSLGGAASREAIVDGVRRLVALSEQLRAARTGQEAAQSQREFDAVSTRIDRLVYDRYGLTEDEIALVEGSVPLN